MFVSRHARIRLRERSQMSLQQVRELLLAQAYVSLGTTMQYRYLLFYSYVDKCCLIAVVDSNTGKLVSVWYDAFTLPDVVTKPSPELRTYAEGLYYDRYHFQAAESDLLYHNTLLVYEGDKHIFGFSNPRLTTGLLNRSELLWLWRDQLWRLYRLVEEHVHFAKKPISYQLESYHCENLDEYRETVLRHSQKLHNWLQKHTVPA